MAQAGPKAQLASKHDANRVGECDGSDPSDPHTIATGAATAWDNPEVTPRSALPIGSGLSLREPGKLKDQFTELRGARMAGEENIQEALEDPTCRIVRTQRMRRLLGPSGTPENGARPEQRIIAVPTRDEDRRPREADP
ncbi:hypothetical protein NDU88_001968 [Pleurodeles waltl]|uniref:Uncharacterized protein n=1 Tax=Pleurodeles waltl TaxID=8319 RepID=A0AAV7SBK7_PLEWA|nr:hypothetical protein NDU88_001968 [Pleurodeles waltl]